MNKRFSIMRIAAYITTILIVTVVIASHNTLTTPRIIVALAALMLGVLLLLLCDDIADVPPSEKGEKLIGSIIHKKPYSSLYDKELTDDEKRKISPLFSFGLSPKELFIIVMINVIGVVVRMLFLPFQSADFVMFQVEWHAQLAGQGLNALSMNVGDYSPLYMTFFSLLCQTPLSVLIITKYIPATFDFVLAVFTMLISHEVMGEKSTFGKRAAVYAAVLLNPLLVLNAACWAQCDSLYATFVIICLYILIRSTKNRAKYSGDVAVIFLAVAFAFKFQTVLFFPVIFFVWLTQREKILRVSQAVWLPVVYFTSCIPMFIKGRTIESLLGVYFGQIGEYNTILTMRYPNVYSFASLIFDNPPAFLGKIGMIITAFLLLCLYFYIFAKKAELTGHVLLKVSVLSVLMMVYFMPSMHERYAFIAEMLIVILAVIELKYIAYAAATVACTLIAYIDYLLYYRDIYMPPDILISLIRLAVIVLIAMDIIKEINNDKKQLPRYKNGRI